MEIVQQQLVVLLYKDTWKPFSEFGIRFWSTQRCRSLGYQTNDVGGDILVIFGCLALGEDILVMSRHSGYIRCIKPLPRHQFHVSEIALVL